MNYLGKVGNNAITKGRASDLWDRRHIKGNDTQIRFRLISPVYSRVQADKGISPDRRGGQVEIPRSRVTTRRGSLVDSLVIEYEI